MTDHQCLSFTADDAVAARLGLGAAALRYQALGYAVLPLATAAKKPHRMLGQIGGVHLATTRPDIIWWAWSQDKAAGVGIATGQPSRLVVIDLDVKGLHNGVAEFTRFMTGSDWGHRVYAIQQAFPGAPVAQSPSGGLHIWLRSGSWPVPQRLGILPGVDIKGDGGYVVAAPTMINQPTLDGETVLLPYSWAQGCPCSVPPAPDWLFEWIASAPASAAEIAGGGSAGPAVDLGALRETGLQQGSRNAGLYRLACSLYAQWGTDMNGQSAVAGAVAEVLAKTDRRDFGQREVATILASARSFIERARERDAQAGEAARRWLTR
jgi:hypothetical protein